MEVAVGAVVAFQDEGNLRILVVVARIAGQADLEVDASYLEADVLRRGIRRVSWRSRRSSESERDY